MAAITKRRRYLRGEVALGVTGEVMPNEKHKHGKGVIYGVAIMTEGNVSEISGDYRNEDIDEKTLRQIGELGNAKPDGLKMRFGHPNMSSTALGTFLARGKNFRIDGGEGRPKVVRADAYLDKTAYRTPGGDLASYVLDLAESDPAAFGTSIVFDHDDDNEIRRDEDGEPLKDENGNRLPPVLRVKRLYAADVVDDPAANYEFFDSSKFYSKSTKLAHCATQLLDGIFEEEPDAEELLNRFLAAPGALDNTLAFLRRFISNKTRKSLPLTQEATMPDEIKEAVDVAEEPEGAVEPVEEPEVENEPAGDPALNGAPASDDDEPEQEKVVTAAKSEEIKATVLAGERERVAEINKHAKAMGLEPVGSEIAALGVSVEEAVETLKKRRLAELSTASAVKAVGPNAELHQGSPEFDLEDEETWEAAWKASKKLRKEFMYDKDAFNAFNRADAKGLIKIKGS